MTTGPLTAAQIARLAATPARYEAAYPVASGAETLEQHAAQMAANDKVLRQARRDIAARLVAST